MATIRHELSIDAPPEKVYEALSSADRIGTWWDKQTAVPTDRGLVLEHNPGPEHGVVQLRVVEQIPNRRVEWECISLHPGSSPASAWTGTRFIFELSGRSQSRGAGTFRRTAHWCISSRSAMTNAANITKQIKPPGWKSCKT